MTPEQLQARIQELEAHRERVAVEGQKAEALAKRCRDEMIGASGAIQELQRLLAELSMPAEPKAS